MLDESAMICNWKHIEGSYPPYLTIKTVKFKNTVKVIFKKVFKGNLLVKVSYEPSIEERE